MCAPHNKNFIAIWQIPVDGHLAIWQVISTNKRHPTPAPRRGSWRRTVTVSVQEIIAKDRARRISGAVRYAAANKSDPFAYARAMTHVNNGIAGPNVRHERLEYDAEAMTEMRKLPDGIEYQAEIFRNVTRA